MRSSRHEKHGIEAVTAIDLGHRFFVFEVEWVAQATHQRGDAVLLGEAHRGASVADDPRTGDVDAQSSDEFHAAGHWQPASFFGMLGDRYQQFAAPAMGHSRRALDDIEVPQVRRIEAAGKQ